MATHVTTSRSGVLGDRTFESAAERRKAQPVVWWAGIGALISAFWLYIVIAWVTGPNFERVEPGPTAAPDWMGPAQTAFQVALAVATLALIWKMIVQPWRRERRVTTDGALLVAFFTMYFQDQLTNAGGYWFTYNAHVFNMGSWFPEIPGWLTFAQPGATAPEPIFMMATGYIYFFVASLFVGMFIMRKAKQRWPSLSTPALFGLVFVAMALVDVFIEVFMWLPMGFYAYTWAPGPMINAGTPHQFPIIEAVMVGVLSTAIVAFRYYTDDKGQTVVERGIDKVQTTPGKKGIVRLFALIAAIQVIFFVAYNVPMYMVGAHSKDWPESIQERSYLTNFICGDGTSRACPTKDLPQVRNSGTAITVDPQGKLVAPNGSDAGAFVPFRP